jgi:hypothetical protein
MKPSTISWSLLAGLWLGIGAVDPAVGAEGEEARALRRASGVYGLTTGGLPDGFFDGTVGNDYNEHASVRLTARSGEGDTSLVVEVFDNHFIRFEGITAKVRAGGRVVTFSGGHVKGTGLLPYGIRILRGRILSGSVNLEDGPPRFRSKMSLAGIDLTRGSARVSGTAIVTARR